METNAKPVILEVALNGVTNRDRNPSVPLTPSEIAEDALRCIEAGASIIHTHTHDFGLPAPEAAALYLEAYSAVLAKQPNAILYPTAGMGTTAAERHGHHDVLAQAGAIRMGLLDPGSVNLGAVGEDGYPIPLDFVYANSPVDIRHQLETCLRFRLGGSIAIFEPGWLRTVVAFHHAGTLPAGSLVKFYFSGGAYFGGGEPMFSPPPIREALDLYNAIVGDAQIPWAVAVLGSSLLDSPIAALAVERGGHLRVGLEDDPTAANLDQVERARAFCEARGRRLATLEETESILGLPPVAKS